MPICIYRKYCWNERKQGKDQINEEGGWTRMVGLLLKVGVDSKGDRIVEMRAWGRLLTSQQVVGMMLMLQFLNHSHQRAPKFPWLPPLPWVTCPKPSWIFCCPHGFPVISLLSFLFACLLASVSSNHNWMLVWPYCSNPHDGILVSNAITFDSRAFEV